MSNVTEYDHLGKHIVQVAFPAGTGPAALKGIFAEAKAAYDRQPKGSVLCLSLFEGFEVDESMIGLFEAAAKSNVGTVKATAFVGVSGPQQALFKAMIGITGRDGRLFAGVDEAKDWLAAFKSADEALGSL